MRSISFTNKIIGILLFFTLLFQIIFCQYSKYRKHPLKTLQTITLQIGSTKNKLQLWVMNSDHKMAEGMMFLQDHEVKANQGMLFIHPKPQVLRYWMRNTLIPLDVLYLDLNGKILNIEVLKPLNLESVPSKGLAKYAIELKAGTSQKLNIKPGMRVMIPKNLKHLSK